MLGLWEGGKRKHMGTILVTPLITFWRIFFRSFRVQSEGPRCQHDRIELVPGRLAIFRIYGHVHHVSKTHTGCSNLVQKRAYSRGQGRLLALDPIVGQGSDKQEGFGIAISINIYNTWKPNDVSFLHWKGLFVKGPFEVRRYGGSISSKRW